MGPGIEQTSSWILVRFVTAEPQQELQILVFSDWECPMLEENVICKNSTLLDTSKAVAIEKAPQFSNLSAILGKFHILFPHVSGGNPCLY